MAKIFLIDDDPDIRKILRMMLEKEGYQVMTAAHRGEALALLASEKPSLILLDVLLSGDDGRELCRQIKGDDRTKDIPVIMFSGHPGAANNFESYGADDFIGKPFTSEMLFQKLQQLIA